MTKPQKMNLTKRQSFGSVGGKLFQFIDWMDNNGNIIKWSIRTEESSTPNVHEVTTSQNAERKAK